MPLFQEPRQPPLAIGIGGMAAVPPFPTSYPIWRSKNLMPRIKTFQPNLEKVMHRGDPSWRVRRATELYRQCIGTDGRLVRNQISKWVEGAAVYRYVRYLKANRRGYVQERRQAAMLKQFIDIDLARAIESQASHKRLELRLRILAGESLHVIAKTMNLDEMVVRTYCCYFFDVYHQKHAYLINLPRPGSAYAASISPAIDRAIKSDHLEYFCYRMVDAYGPILIDRLVELFVHYGEQHDFKTKVGRNREVMELRFESYMLPRPSTITEIGGSQLLAERLRQSSSYLASDCNLAFGRSVLDQLFRNTVPTPVDAVDFDFVAPRKANTTETVQLRV